MASYTLALDTGAYSLDGQAINLPVGHRLVLAGGSYTLSGQAVALTYLVYLNRATRRIMLVTGRLTRNRRRGP